MTPSMGSMIPLSVAIIEVIPGEKGVEAVGKRSIYGIRRNISLIVCDINPQKVILQINITTNTGDLRIFEILLP